MSQRERAQELAPVESTAGRDAAETRSDGAYAAFLERAGNNPAKARALMRRAQERRERSRDGGGPQIVDPKDDEMSVIAVEEKDVQTIRDRLIDRVDDAHDKGELAIHRFESILRHRDAEPALEKGFGETAKKTAVDWFVDKLTEGAKGVLEAAELPVVGVEKGVSIAREGLEGETEAKKAAAKLHIVDELVNSTRHAFAQATAAAKSAIRGAPPTVLFKADAAANDQRPIISSTDVDEIDARLLSMTRNAMLSSGAITVNEYLDQVKHDKNEMDAEIDASKKAQKE